jgi:tetratricopeptide (TPR) repeat protein
MRDALAAYGEVIERDARSPAALTGAAGALMRLGRLDEARAHAELAVAVAPAAAHELLARIALERGDAEAARREAALAQAADPSLPLHSFVEGVIRYRQGRFAEAIPPLMKAQEALEGRTEQIPDVHFLLADSLARMERYGEAEPFFARELALFPGHVRARAGLAMLYRATGRNAESERAIADLLRHAPGPEAYDVAARLWSMFGHPGRAAAVRAEARRLPE